MGAWIEILNNLRKQVIDCVAPLVGAWIEIKKVGEAGKKVTVAPLVGAWIEISGPGRQTILNMSLPSWERGLKLPAKPCLLVVIHVAPLVGAWIEISMLLL